MSTDYFMDVMLPDRGKVVVNYEFSHGSPTTYSPMTGAHGGDPDEVAILECWGHKDEVDVKLTDDEYEKVEGYILEKHFEEYGYDDEDPY